MATEPSIYDHYLLIAHGRTKSSTNITIPEGYRFIFFSPTGESVNVEKISSFIRLVNQKNGAKILNYLARENTCQAMYQMHACPSDGDNNPDDEIYIPYRNLDPRLYPLEHFEPRFISDLRHFIAGDIIPDMELVFHPHFINTISKTNPHGDLYRMGVIPLLPGRIDFSDRFSYQGKGYTKFPPSKELYNLAFAGNTSELKILFDNKEKKGESDYIWTSEYDMFSDRKEAGKRKVNLSELIEFLNPGTYFIGACRNYYHYWTAVIDTYRLKGIQKYNDSTSELSLTHINDMPLDKYLTDNPKMNKEKCQELLTRVIRNKSLVRQTSNDKLDPKPLSLLRQTSDKIKESHVPPIFGIGPSPPPGTWYCGKCNKEVVPGSIHHHESKGGSLHHKYKVKIKYPKIF